MITAEQLMEWEREAKYGIKADPGSSRPPRILVLIAEVRNLSGLASERAHEIGDLHHAADAMAARLALLEKVAEAARDVCDADFDDDGEAGTDALMCVETLERALATLEAGR